MTCNLSEMREERRYRPKLISQHSNNSNSNFSSISLQRLRIIQPNKFVCFTLLIFFCSYHYSDANVATAFIMSTTYHCRSKSATIQNQYPHFSFPRDYIVGSIQQQRIHPYSCLHSNPVDMNESNDDFDEENEYITNNFIDEDDENDVDINMIQSLTVPQLKQQLRLRGLKVTGRKQELMDRLISSFRSTTTSKTTSSTSSSTSSTSKTDSKNKPSTESKTGAQEAAEALRKEFIDVSAYLDTDEANDDNQIQQQQKEENEGEEGAEVWGNEAKKVRIMSDLNDDNPVIDNLSRTVIEYSGYQKEKCNAYVVASRDSLKGYLSGGSSTATTTTIHQQKETSMQKVSEIQIQREKASKAPMSQQQKNQEEAEIDEGIVEPGEEHTPYDNIIDRDYTDWGAYTHTGAQISASEVQGILFLSDVYGPFHKDAKALCDKIAHECQPCVILAPDLFRGRPWEVPEEGSDGTNSLGQDYETWRAQHSEERVNVDIRASAMILRERYAVSSVAVFGTCFGGGRALEAAAGWIPQDKRNDPHVNLIMGPQLVDPSACIAWYPTRYNAKHLFGSNRRVASYQESFTSQPVAVMGIFADEDVIPGATPDDAAELKDLLESDERIKDNMIKVFPGQTHGFAHKGLGDREGKGVIGGGDGEVAALLSTAFLETYTRVFLPTVGVPIMNDDAEDDWNRIEMRENIGSVKRDIRAEIEAAEKEYDDSFDDYDLDYTDVSTQVW